MKRDTFTSQIFVPTIAQMERLLVVKNGEYAGSDEDRDYLANFKEAARRMGIDPREVAMIYLDKHYAALCNYTKDLRSNKDREVSEPITGRIHDIMNYCLLMLGLIYETEPKKHDSNSKQDRKLYNDPKYVSQ